MRVAHRFGLGLAALGRPAYITTGRADDLSGSRSVADLRERTAHVLDAAYAAGVRYLDCARSYGYAESFLADWLAARPDVDDVEVASKWGYRYVGDWRRDADVHEVKDHSGEAFAEQWEQTRDILGDRLALYQVHSLMPDDPLFDDAATLESLGALRDSGVQVGFTTSGPHQGDTVQRALAVEVGGARLFSLVQATWNVLEPSAGPALAAAAEAGCQVVVKEAMANGRLSPDGADDAPAAALLRRMAGRLGVAGDALALAVVLHQPWVGRVLSGAVTEAQLASNLAAVEVALDRDQVRELTATPEPAGRYWSERSDRAWT